MDIHYSLPNVTSTLQILGCHIGETKPNWLYPWHHHYLFELLFIKEGDVMQTVGEETFQLKQGDWLLIKSGISHATENSSDFKYSFFNLHFDLDDPLIREQLCQSNYILIGQDEEINAALNEHYIKLEKAIKLNHAGESSKQSQAVNQLIIQSHTLAIIGTIIEFSNTTKMLSVEPYALNTANGSTIAETEIAHAIEARLRQKHTEKINDIALGLGMSRGRCTHIFTKVFGQSPRQYASRLILNQAKHFLVHSTLTMEEIAERLEFQSASHFSRQFRRWTGVAPTTFRPKFARVIKHEEIL